MYVIIITYRPCNHGNMYVYIILHYLIIDHIGPPTICVCPNYITLSVLFI